MPKTATTTRRAAKKRSVKGGRPLAFGEIEKFSLIDKPTAYVNKPEITNTDPHFLVVESQNTLISDADKVVTRKGYIKDGQARTVTKKTDSSVDWVSKWGLKVLKTNQGATAGTGKLKIRSTDYLTGNIIYQTILSSLTLTEFEYSTWWNSTENQDLLLFTNGTTTLQAYSGGAGYVDTVVGGATTLTLLGGGTWKQSGFLSSTSGRAVVINGVAYTYSGGESTTVLTGVAPVAATPTGTFVSQEVVPHTSITGLPSTYVFDRITVQTNQVWLGSTLSREVYVSKSTDYLDYTYTSPVRLPSDGWKMTFDNCTIAFIEDNNVMYVAAGNEDYYEINREMTADQTGESFRIKKLRSGPGQAPISQSAVIKVKNGIIIVTQEKTVDWFANIENVTTKQSLPISDPIKNDFDAYDLSGVSGKYFDNQLQIAVPAENLVRIYDFNKGLWQPPQTIPVSFFTIIANELYGHSNSSDVSYKLNDGLNDDGVSIDFIAAFSYRTFGDRAVYKSFDDYYNELYMSTITTVTATHRFEYGGSDQILLRSIAGTDTALMFAPAYDPSLGKNPIGSNPLGSTSQSVLPLNKYRCVHELKKADFFEHQVLYSASEKDAQFELLAHGPNVTMSKNIPRSITR